MEWRGFNDLPVMLSGTKRVRFDGDFTIKAMVKPYLLGGKKVICSKRVPVSRGNRPGVILLVHGNCVELMTFQESGSSWKTARTYAKVMKPGEIHEILAFRLGGKAYIYVNGIDQTNPDYQEIHSGDLNCDVDMFVGCQIYDQPVPRDTFKGVIGFLGVYEQEYISDASPIRFLKNPLAFSLSELPTMVKHLNIPIGG